MSEQAQTNQAPKITYCPPAVAKGYDINRLANSLVLVVRNENKRYRAAKEANKAYRPLPSPFNIPVSTGQ